MYPDPFLNRLRWLMLAAIMVLLIWQFLPWIERYLIWDQLGW